MMKQIILGAWVAASCLLAAPSIAQTDADGLMMAKNNFCGGAMYMHASWNHYWEGTLKRNNLNLGTVSTTTYNLMGNYGITGKLNFLFNVPYVRTKASAGNLAGQQGMQDLSLWLKYMPIEKSIGDGFLSVYGLLGYSTPLSNYTADLLPLSIGLRSKTTTLRAMVDYQLGSFTTTASASFMHRQNITLDRTAYYTTEMHYTNEVFMPNASQWQVRSGYRSERWIAEATYTQFTTLGGFDITRNNVPFPSNRMNAGMLGTNIKYNFLNKLNGLSIVANTQHVLSGRNVGQTNAYGLGVFYIMNMPKLGGKKAKP